MIRSRSATVALALYQNRYCGRSLVTARPNSKIFIPCFLSFRLTPAASTNLSWAILVPKNPASIERTAGPQWSQVFCLRRGSFGNGLLNVFAIFGEETGKKVLKFQAV